MCGCLSKKRQNAACLLSLVLSPLHELARTQAVEAISGTPSGPLAITNVMARRIKALNTEMRNIDRILTALIGETAPSLLELYGLGPDTAASLLVAAGDNPERLHSEQAWAHMCGVTPIAASSGKTTRYRLNRGGDRNANAALYRIVLTRMSSHDETRQYVTRRRTEGLNTAEIMRCLKRYVARQVYKHLPQTV